MSCPSHTIHFHSYFLLIVSDNKSITDLNFNGQKKDRYTIDNEYAVPKYIDTQKETVTRIILKIINIHIT